MSRTRPLRNLAEIAVIGGGLAGLSAARHAQRLGRNVTLFEGSGLWGGQVATVEEVDGLMLPGRLSGQDLAIPLLDECRKVQVRVIERGVTALDTGETLMLTDESGEVHTPDAVIVATGGTLRKLCVPGEEALYGRGVSRCASCDGGFFRGQDVVVVGGGDAAFHEALLLAKTSGTVTMVCRGPVRAKRDYVDRLAARRNVRFLWDSVVVAIEGADGVTGVTIRSVQDSAETFVPCAGVFPFVGVEPVAGFVPAALRDANGLIVTGKDHTTADPRIFAAGAARAGYGGNALQAMAEGIAAATAAAKAVAPIYA